MGGESLSGREVNDENEIGTNETNAHRGEFITRRGEITNGMRWAWVARA